MKVALGTLLFTVLVPGTAVIGIPYFLLGLDWLPGNDIGVLRFFGLIPIIVGGIFYLWNAWDFTFTGRGTPAPVYAPRKLVTGRLYRRVRNPMYVGITSILLGESLLFMSLILLGYALFFWLIFHLFVVFYEEPHLEKIFGAQYREYREKVPRWIPGIKRTGGKR